MIETALHISNPDQLGRLAAFLETGDLQALLRPEHAAQLELRALETLHVALPASLPPVSRLYLGNEFCPHLAWTAVELARGLAEARRHGLAMTLVFGPQREQDIDATLVTISSLAREHSLEVVANDWGLVAALATSSVSLVAGRMLYKAKRNPRISATTPPQGLPAGADAPAHVLSRQLTQWALLPFDSPWLRRWCNDHGVVRAEVELVPQGLVARSDVDLPLSLYLPWTYITGGGHCPVAHLVSTEGQVRCARRCRSTWIEATYPARTWPLPQVGQTVFSPMVSLLKGYLEHARIDRYVYEPVLPM
jgi:hypothetical protein